MNGTKLQLIVLLSIFWISVTDAQTNIISNESDVPFYQLPELLVTNAGEKVTSAFDWNKVRRNEVFQLLESQMYGKVPTSGVKMVGEVTFFREKALNGKATMMEMTLTLTYQDRTMPIELLLFLPNKNKEPVPVFLGYNFMGNHTIYQEELLNMPKGWVSNNPNLGVTDNQANGLGRGMRANRWPVLNLINRGYGVVTMYYGDVDPDFDDGFKNGAHAFMDAFPTNAGWGSIAAWSWGLSRVLDYFQNIPRIDKTKVAVMGHSRLGKAALWAGALDQRFAMVISNNSGCGGAALSNRQFGETVEAINTKFPHWFAKNFHQYNGKESTMPFDQHFLLSLIAPRPLYIASAEADTWADPKGEFLAGVYASPVYNLYQKKGLELTQQPAINQPYMDGLIGYHVRNGRHDLTVYDWERFMDFADIHWKK